MGDYLVAAIARDMAKIAGVSLFIGLAIGAFVTWML